MCNYKETKVMIIGAGEAGQMVISEIDKNRKKLKRRVEAILDDNEKIIGKNICGHKV